MQLSLNTRRAFTVSRKHSSRHSATQSNHSARRSNRVGHLQGSRKLTVWGTLRRQRDPDGLSDQYFSDCCVDRCEEMEEKVRRNYEE